MASLSLKAKLNLLVFVPLASAYAASSFALYLTHSPILIVASSFIFLSIASIANIYLNNFSRKLMKNLKHVQVDIECVNFSAKLLISEIDKMSFDCSENFKDLRSQLSGVCDPLVNVSAKAKGLSKVYDALKVLMVLSMQQAEKSVGDKKAHLTLAKELGFLCIEIKEIEVEMQGLILSSVSKCPSIIERLQNVAVIEPSTEKHLLISENIIGMTVRLDNTINALYERKVETKARLPLKLAEKRAA